MSLPRCNCLLRLPQVALLLGVMCGTLSCIAQTDDPYQTGKQAFSEHRYKEAAAFFGNASKQTDKGGALLHPDALLLQGKSLINIEDLAGAEDALRRALLQN